MIYLELTLRALVMYFVILVTFRIMGKREVGELSIFDLIIFLIISEIAAISIENLEDPLMHMVYTIILLTIVQKIISFISLKSSKVRNLVDGKPSMIIYKGKINVEEMKKQNYTFDDLILQMREKDFKSISEIEYALLEVSGSLSIFRKEKDDILPFPLIVSGEVSKKHLEIMNLDEQWLKSKLSEKGIFDYKEVYYANVENGELFIITKDDLF